MSDKDMKLRLIVEAKNEADAALNDLNADLLRTGKGADDLRGSMSLLSMAAKGAVGALAATITTDAAARLVSLADAYTLAEGRLRLVTSSSAELVAVQDELFDSALRTRTEYLSNVEGYARLAQNTKDLHLAQSELLTINETLNKAFIISGATEAERSSTMIQLSQAFSAGVLRGEEFNSVAEQGSRVLQLLADYTGKSRGELRAMAEAGQLTADVLTQAILTGANRVNGEFGKMPITVGQAGDIMKTVLSDLVSDANKATGATEDIANAIRDVALAINENRAGITSFFTDLAGFSAQITALPEQLDKEMWQSVNKFTSTLGTKSDELRSNISALEAEIDRVNSHSGIKAIKVDSGEYAQMTSQLEQQKGLLKDLTSSPYVTGEAAGKINIIAAAFNNTTFAMKGVKNESQSSMRITDDMRQKMLKYIETRDQALKRERDVAMAGAKTSEERNLIEKKYQEELIQLAEKSAKAQSSGPRSELKQLNAELRNFTDQARDAAQAADEWLRIANSSGAAVADLIDWYATAGMGEFAAGVYEQSKALTEARKDIDAYSGSLETIDGQIAAVTAAYEDSNAKLGELRGKLGGNAAGSEIQDANAVNALQEQTEKLLETLKELAAEKTRMQGLQGGAEGLLGQIDESYRAERLQSAYSQIGAYTADIYAVLKEEYIADAAAFEAATGNKIAAQKMLERKMAELDLSNPGTSWARAFEIGLKDVAEQAKITGEEIRSYIVQAVDQLNDALVDFLLEGTSAKGVLHSLSREMLAMTTKELITGPAAGGIAGLFKMGGASSANAVAINSPAMVSINGAGGVSWGDFPSLFGSSAQDSWSMDSISASDAWSMDSIFGDSESDAGSFWDTFYSDGENVSGSLWSGFGTDGEGAFASIFSGLGDALSSVFGGTSAGGSSLFSSIWSMFGFADGGVFSAPGISAYSNSVVSSPTLFPFAQGIGLMGEAGAEAVMPLTRNRQGTLVGDARIFGGNEEIKSMLKELIGAVKGQGNTRIINTFGDAEVANAMSGAAGERVILNAIKRNQSIIRQVAR